MSHKAAQPGCVILDACAIINLCASGRMMEILPSLSGPAVVERWVYEHETLRFDADEGQVTETAGTPLEPLVRTGLLSVVEIETEDEAISLVNFSAEMHDGEARTAALAVHRNWPLVTDDEHARNVLQRIPGLALLTSLEVIRNWAVGARIDRDTIRLVLRGVRSRGHYVPNRHHPMRAWWDAHI